MEVVEEHHGQRRAAAHHRGRHHDNHPNAAAAAASHAQNVVSGESGASDDDSNIDVEVDMDDDDNNNKDIFDVGGYDMDDIGCAFASYLSSVRKDGRGRGQEGEEDQEDDDDDNDDDDDDDRYVEHHPEFLYDANLDEEDEAWVYRNRRGGVKENVKFIKRPHRRNDRQEENEGTRGTEQQSKRQLDGEVPTTSTTIHAETDRGNSSLCGRRQQQQQQQQKVYKIRSSDAVLSCPCCFNIVCMDCQRHSRYPNQFRAMFVMGIKVAWNKRLVYDHTLDALVPKYQHNNRSQLEEQVENVTTTLVEEEDHHRDQDNGDDSNSQQPCHYNIPKIVKGEYFATLCANCETQVAALDMVDGGVYHFYGCLESAAPS